MRVKVGDKVYDSDDVAIAVCFDDDEKKDVAELEADQSIYCRYPADWTDEQAEEFMSDL